MGLKVLNKNNEYVDVESKYPKEEEEEVNEFDASLERIEDSDNMISPPPLLTPNKNYDMKEILTADTTRLDLATALIADTFNIGENFYVTKVDDKGSNITVGFSNRDFDVTVKIKDTDLLEKKEEE